jgi:membrane-associated phospholipid phosphatase
MSMLRILILFLFVMHRQGLMSQTDTLSAAMMPAAQAGYEPDVFRGVSYRGMADINPQAKTGRNIFNRRGSAFILPTLFIAYGTAARFNQLPVRRLDFAVDREVRRHITRHYYIDDIFQYGMPVVAYGLDFIPGLESRHNLRDRTLIMATSAVVMQSAVSILKSTTAVARPGNGRHNSFPSGHTASTMMSAHILYREYKDVTPWIGVCGYLMATTTGVFRIINSAHWQSDVIAGAGIGLLSAEIGYRMLPVWHSLLGIKDGGGWQVAAVPVISTRSLGASLVCRF